MSEFKSIPMWKWDDSAGIINQHGRQVIQILPTHSKIARKREGKLIVELLNAHCIPSSEGRPKRPREQPPKSK